MGTGDYIFITTVGLLLAVVSGIVAPHWWAIKDAATFNATPSQDDYHGLFHRQRATWRVGYAVVVALVLALPWGIFFNWWAYGPAALAYIIGSLGYFAYAFNNLLSAARHLNYVGHGYVSPDPRAANPDRWIWAKVTGILGTAGNVPVRPADPVSPTVAQYVASLVLDLLQNFMLALSLTATGFLLIIATILAHLCS